MEFAERLKRIITESGLSAVEFAQKCGISNSSLQRYLDGKNEPKAPFLRKLVSLFNVDINWLLTGSGEPYRKAKATLTYLHPDLHVPKEEYFLIPLIEAEVASDLEEISASKIKDWVPLSFKWLKEWGLSTAEEIKNLLVVEVEDRTMIPTIPEKSTVLLDRNQKARDRIVKGGIYLIRRRDDTLSIKRVIYDNYKLFCLPENWVKYSCYEIELSPEDSLSKYILGRVIWVCQSFV